MIRLVTLSMIFGLVSGLAPGEEYSATVIAVIEGDLLSVQRDGAAGVVRLYAVDTPEQGQTFADESRKMASDLALNKEVKVNVLTRDNLGKEVAWVTLPDGRNLNQELVAAGMAWWDQKHAEDDRGLKKSNAQAISEKKGLWTESTPLAPWDFRQSKGQAEVVYEVDKKTEETTEVKPEVKSVSAKGTGDYSALINLAGGSADDLGDVDVGGLMMKHRPSPVTDADGKITGWTAKDISQIPGAQQLGFQEGDIVSSINGMPLGDMASLMGMAQQLKSAPQLQVDIIRGGQPVTITIPIR